LHLKKFDMTRLKFEKYHGYSSKSPDNILIIGRRNVGKTFLIRDIMHHNQDIACGVAVSGTECYKKKYQAFLPKVLIHAEYTPSIIENVLKRQKHVFEEIKRQSLIQVVGEPTVEIDRRAFVILDACMYDSQWTKCKLMRLLYMNNRSFSTMVIYSMQYPLGIPPALRGNVDFVFVFKDDIVSNRRRIFDNYVEPYFTDSFGFDGFCSVMDALCTSDHGCLVIDNNPRPQFNISDNMFWYKANSHEKFKICSNFGQVL